MIGTKTNKTIKELFESLYSRYQIKLEELMKGNKFVFDLSGGLLYRYNNTRLNRCRS